MLPIDIRHRHAERRANAREGENQKTDQRPVTQAADCSGVDAVQELARFERTQYRGLASADHVFGTAHGGGGIYSEYLANHQPVEQHADGREPLFDRRRRKSAAYILDPGRDVHGFDVKQLDEAGLVAPVEKFAGGTIVGFAGIRVADVGGEEFDEAPAGMPAARSDQCRDDGIGCGQKYDREIAGIGLHGAHYASSLMNDKGRYHSLDLVAGRGLLSLSELFGVELFLLFGVVATKIY